MNLFTAIAILIAVTLIVVCVLHGSLSGDWRIFVSEKTREREREEYHERYNVEHEFGAFPARSISFNDRFDLTRATVTGRKTSTRIIIDCDPTRDYDRNKVPLYEVGRSYPVTMSYNDQLKFNHRCMLAMRDDYDLRMFKDEYRAEFGSKGWTDKEYVKPSLMLFRVVITGRCMKHLQDITDEEIFREGIKDFGDERYGFTDTGREFFQNRVFDSPRDAYKALMKATEGKSVWEANPWVLVLEFEPDPGNFRYVKAWKAKKTQVEKS